MNSRHSLSPALTDVWRITSQAHSDVGQLPLTLLPFNKTEEFLSNIGQFSYQTAVRDLDKTPLSDNEYETLKTLYKQSEGIQNELRSVQRTVLKNNLRWMDVEMALASGKENADNTIIDGLKTVEKTITGYDETDMGPAFMNMQNKNDNYNNIHGKAIFQKDAVGIAKKYMKIAGNLQVKVTESGKGSKYGFYSVSLKNTKTNEEGNMDITKKGGLPIWFINSRQVTTQTLSLHDAGNRAADFLHKAGFSNMELYDSTQYDNIGVFNFITNQNNIRIYPESIKIKVALDNGSIIGFSGDDYLQTHYKRKLPNPIISKEQAMAKINPNVKIMDQREAVINNDLKQDVLCYEFLGIMGNDTYRIFINTQNGHEEEVEKLKNTEAVSADVL